VSGPRVKQPVELTLWGVACSVGIARGGAIAPTADGTVVAQVWREKRVLEGVVGPFDGRHVWEEFAVRVKGGCKGEVGPGLLLGQIGVAIGLAVAMVATALARLPAVGAVVTVDAAVVAVDVCLAFTVIVMVVALVRAVATLIVLPVVALWSVVALLIVTLTIVIAVLVVVA
jgi:hypothetical protein